MGDFVGGEIADLLAQRHDAEFGVLARAPPIGKGQFLKLADRLLA